MQVQAQEIVAGDYVQTDTGRYEKIIRSERIAENLWAVVGETTEWRMSPDQQFTIIRTP